MLKAVLFSAGVAFSIYWMPRIKESIAIYRKKSYLYSINKNEKKYHGYNDKKILLMIRDEYLNDQTFILNNLLYSPTELNLISSMSLHSSIE